MGLETHDLYAMGYMNLTTRNLSISALISVTLDGVVGVDFDGLG